MLMATWTPGDVPDIDLADPLVTDQDVLRRVDRLLDQDSRQQRSVWLLFLSGDGVQLPAVAPIDDVPERPDPFLVGNLCGVIAEVLADAAPGGSAVVALTRPGEETLGDTDRYWFRALHSAARERGASIRMLCLATQSGVRPLTIDDAG
jgi:hypothetical protein